MPRGTLVPGAVGVSMPDCPRHADHALAGRRALQLVEGVLQALRVESGIRHLLAARRRGHRDLSAIAEDALDEPHAVADRPHAMHGNQPGAAEIEGILRAGYVADHRVEERVDAVGEPEARVEARGEAREG